eukprot:97113_1
MASNFENDCQRLIGIFNKTQSGDTQLIRQAEQELSQIEIQDGFLPFLLKFLSQSPTNNENGNKPRFSASIRFKNLVKFRWKTTLNDNDKETIRNGIFQQCINQKDGAIRRQLFTTIRFLIDCDFPANWSELLPNVAKCIQTNNPYMILGGLSILLSVYKKYHFVNRQRKGNPIEKMITDTWPTLANILNVSLDLYNSKLQQQQGALNYELQILLQILKIIFRIFYVSIFMQLPSHMRSPGIFETWMNLFIKFFEIKPPKDLQLNRSNKDQLTEDSLYSIAEYSKYYSNPYVKARKWAVRCITRTMQLYGRPQYVMHKENKPLAQVFLDQFARKFMELFYFGIIRQHIGDQFVYFKTLAPAITYINLCIHYGTLFQLLLENNAKYLDNILFVCMFRIVRLTCRDLSLWQDDPAGFVENSFRFGTAAFDDAYDPRSSALKLIQDLVRIRSRYTFDKLLEFSQKVISSSGSCGGDKSASQIMDQMVDKDAVLCILGQLSNILRRANEEAYCGALRSLIMQHVVPDFSSTFGFLRARACWLVGKYWKLSFCRREWQSIGMCVIKSLHDAELPVQMEASSGLSKIVLEQSGELISFIKPQIPSILGRYLEIMNDIGTEAVVQTFDTLIDRLDSGIIPFATDLLSKMLDMFYQFHSGIESYVRSHPEEYANFELPNGEIANRNVCAAAIKAKDEEQQRESLKQFDDNLSSAMQCLKAIHTILFSSTALPELLAKLEELMQPLISRLFGRDYLYFQFYREEVLDFVHLFSYYMTPLSLYCWKVFPAILEGYCLNLWSDQFNRCMQCAVNYVKAAHRDALPFDNFMNQNYLDIALTFGETAVHDDNANVLMFTSLFENLLCLFRPADGAITMDAYISRILDMVMNKYSSADLQPSTQGAMLAIVALCAYNNPTLFIRILEQNKQTPAVLALLMTNYHDLMWPQQKALVFGLSSLLLIDPQNIPPNLGNKYPQLIDVVSKSVIYMNWEDEDAENLEEEEEEGEDEEDEEDEEEEEEAQEDDDDESEESKKSFNESASKLIDVDAN